MWALRFFILKSQSAHIYQVGSIQLISVIISYQNLNYFYRKDLFTKEKKWPQANAYVYLVLCSENSWGTF